MNKSDLVSTIAKETNCSKSMVKKVVDCLFDEIPKAVKDGTVNITGFGKFYANRIAARKGRNPATGESINIVAKKSPRFKAGAAFKRVVSS